MIAKIEPISAVIRVWIEDDARYGDPYEWVAFGAMAQPDRC